MAFYIFTKAKPYWIIKACGKTPIPAAKNETMKKILCLAIAICIGYAVNAQPPKVPANAGDHFGTTKPTPDNAITVEQAVAKVQGKTDAVDVKVKGKVTAVCQAMGCWVKVASANGEMTVRMKDHAFFVPTALSGKNVIIDGTVQEKLTSVEELKDVAEDAGKSKEEVAKITQPKKEVVISAKGILVL